MVKNGLVAFTTYESGINIYTINDNGTLSELSKDNSTDMYLEVELSHNAEKIFFFRWSLRFEYWTFDRAQAESRKTSTSEKSPKSHDDEGSSGLEKPGQSESQETSETGFEGEGEFKRVQDLRTCYLEQEVDQVRCLRYSDEMQILATVMKLDGMIESNLLIYNPETKLFEFLQTIPSSEFASCVEIVKGGKTILVGFDYNQKTDLDHSEEENPGWNFMQSLKGLGPAVRIYQNKGTSEKQRPSYELAYNLEKPKAFSFAGVQRLRVSCCRQNLAILTNKGSVFIYQLQSTEDCQDDSKPDCCSSSTKPSEKSAKRVKLNTSERSQPLKINFSKEKGTSLIPSEKSRIHSKSIIESRTTTKPPIQPQYKFFQKMESSDHSQFTSLDISQNGLLLFCGEIDGDLTTFIRSDNKKNFELLINCASEVKPVKHTYFSLDDQYLIYEFENGTLKVLEVARLLELKKMVENGQVLKYAPHMQVEWLELTPDSKFLMATMRDTSGTAEGRSTDILELNEETGEFELNFTFEGNGYFITCSEDRLMMFIACFPKVLYKFQRGSIEEKFEKVEFDLKGEVCFSVLIIPGSKDVAVAVHSKKIMFFEYNEAEDDHQLCHEILEEELKNVVEKINYARGGEVLGLGLLEPRFSIARRNPKKRLEYSIVASKELDDLPTDIYISEDLQLVLAPQNNGTIAVFVQTPGREFDYQQTQKIELSGQLGQWNDLRCQVFNQGRYMMAYQRSHHFLSPNADTELRVYSINDHHVEQIDSYGLIHRFYVAKNFDYLVMAECHETNLVKICQIGPSFSIPQNYDMCKLLDKVFAKDSLVIERTKNLFKMYHATWTYLSDSGKQFFSKIQEKLDQKKKKKKKNSCRKRKRVEDFEPRNQKPMTLQKIGSLLKNGSKRKEGYQAWDRFRDEVKLHRQLNLSFIAASLVNLKFSEAVFTIHGYRPLFAPEGYDPVEMALMVNDIDHLNCIVDSIEGKSVEIGYLMSTIDLKKFAQIMNCASFRLKRLILSECFVEPQPCKTNLINSYPLKDSETFRIFPVCGLTFNIELRRLMDNAHNYKAQRKQVNVKCLTFRYSFNPSLTSDSASLILNAYGGLPDDMKTQKFKYLIYHLWRSNYFIICCYSLFVLLTTLMFHFNLTWWSDSTPLTIATTTGCTLLLAYELASLLKNVKEYFKSYYNWLDLYIYIVRPVIVLLNYFGYLNESKGNVSAWDNITMLLAGFRTMTELRVFDSTRVLMAMISQVVSDMIAFIVITFTIMLLFSLVASNINKLDESRSVNNISDFYQLIHHYYDVASGTWEDSVEGMGISETFNFYVSGIALSVLMLNLLIAVISLTFDNFLEKKQLYDLEELCEIMVGHVNFFQRVKAVGRKLLCWRKRKGSVEVKSHYCYLIRDLCDEEVEDKILRRVNRNSVELSGLRQLVKVGVDETDELKRMVDRRLTEILNEVRLARKQQK